MKKFLISIFPLCVIMFILMWISWGLEYALVLFGAVVSVIVLVELQIKWMIFVDKHVKD